MATLEQIEKVGWKISNDGFGGALLKPEPWADQRLCFFNVERKLELDGGSSLYGWMFQLKVPAIGEYVIAIHHAVWRAASGYLFDVTPLHDIPNNRQLTDDGYTLFQVDQKATPIRTEKILAPRPSKFFPLRDSPELVAYVANLQRKENEAIQQQYNSANRLAEKIAKSKGT
jgi:hypothetical protein